MRQGLGLGLGLGRRPPKVGESLGTEAVVGGGFHGRAFRGTEGADIDRSRGPKLGNDVSPTHTCEGERRVGGSG